MKEVPLRTMSGMEAARQAALVTDPDMSEAGGATRNSEIGVPATEPGTKLYKT